MIVTLRLLKLVKVLYLLEEGQENVAFHESFWVYDKFVSYILVKLCIILSYIILYT